MRKLDAVELWEISIVTFPLLNGARVHAVKGQPESGDERLLRRHPRVSFARKRAEKEWRGIAGGAA